MKKRCLFLIILLVIPFSGAIEVAGSFLLENASLNSDVGVSGITGFAVQGDSDSKTGLLEYLLKKFKLSNADVTVMSVREATGSFTIQSPGPTLISAIPNQTWNMNTDNLDAFNLDDYFTDYQGNALNYSISGNVNISVAISSNNSVSFTQPAGWHGMEYVIFNASFGNLSTISNNITLGVRDQEVTSTPGGGGGGGGGATPTQPLNSSKKVLLEMKAPLSQTLYAGDEYDIVITLTNAGDLDLLDITLDTITNAPDLDLTLSNYDVKQLTVGGETYISLNIHSIVPENAHIGVENYFVTINAHVGNYDYSTSVRLYVSLNERDYESRLETLSQLEFAENLLTEKENCTESLGIIQEGRDYYEESDYEKTLSTIDMAIQACRDQGLISEEEEQAIEGIRKTGLAYDFADLGNDIQQNKSSLFIFIVLLILSFATLVAYIYYRQNGGSRSKGQAKDFNHNLEFAFIDLYHEVKHLINHKDIVNARREYLRLHSLYQTVKASTVAPSIKSNYFHKLSLIYSNLSALIKKHERKHKSYST